MSETQDCGCHTARSEEPHGGEGCPDAHGPNHSDTGGALNVRAEPFGPDQTRIEQGVSALVAHPRVAELLVPGDHRLLSFGLEHDGEAVGCACHGDKRVEASVPERFVGTVYDYAENHVLEIRGPLHALDLQAPGSVEVRLLGHQ